MKHSFYFMLLSLMIVASCKKNGFGLTDRKEPDANSALVKVVIVSAPAVGYNATVYINGVRVSYPLATNVGTTTSTPFPGGGLGTGGSNNSDYLIVNPGSNKIEIKVLNNGTATTAYKLFETNQTFVTGKRQTLFISDTSESTTGWIIDIDGSAPDSGFAKLKFVNAIPNVPSVDFYKGTNAATATILASSVNYKSASAYINAGFGADSFFVRPAGAAVATAPVARGRIATANQRLYTLYTRGYNGTTGLRAPVISATINQ